MSVDLAVEEGHPDPRDPVVEGEQDSQEDGAQNLQECPVEVGGVAVVRGLEGLLDLVAVLHVLFGQAGHVLRGQGLLHQQRVEHVHLVLNLVQPGAKKICTGISFKKGFLKAAKIDPFFISQNYVLQISFWGEINSNK